MVGNGLVDTDWLAEHLSDSDLRILDGSWYLPGANRDARAEFEAGHIPGAQFFDIDAIADRASHLPHMLPPAEEFAEAAGALGIGDGDRIVVYDGAGIYSAPRVWWTFRVFGHDRVAVLDGGFPKWKREGRPIGKRSAQRAERAKTGGRASPDRDPLIEREVQAPEPARFRARYRPELVRTLEQMRENVAEQREQVLDARSRGRFQATEPEPRPGVRSGRIPGSKNLPFGELITADGTLLDVESLRRAFEREIDPTRPLVTSCGSGVNAALLALGLHQLGRADVAVYDGSWTEWGGRDDTPVES